MRWKQAAQKRLSGVEWEITNDLSAGSETITETIAHQREAARWEILKKQLESELKENAQRRDTTS